MFLGTLGFKKGAGTRISKSEKSEIGYFIEHIYPPTTSYFTLDVMPDTEYRLRVYAVDGDIYIGASEDVVITTSSGQFACPE
jgi:hypothetical protein